ncbi:YraN family protein [Dichotomicrobium thermohalophilum]|nr:YraN family protein [Dichotomicrobium thermohalophilum]
MLEVEESTNAVNPGNNQSSALRTRKRRKAPSSYLKGIDAEAIAAQILQRKGFRLLDRRYRTAAGELDLVVADGQSLAFVEVKRRTSHATAGEAITVRQQIRMTGAAEIWLQEHPEYADRDITFDAVLICPRSAPQHIPDAFRPAA